MPDITMCLDKKCPKRAKCYRYKATPSVWQSYFSESPRQGKTCEQFWEIKITEKIKIKKTKGETSMNIAPVQNFTQQVITQDPMIGMYIMNSATKEVFEIVGTVQDYYLALDRKKVTTNEYGNEFYGHYRLFSPERIMGYFTIVSYDCYKAEYKKYYKGE